MPMLQRRPVSESVIHPFTHCGIHSFCHSSVCFKHIHSSCTKNLTRMSSSPGHCTNNFITGRPPPQHIADRVERHAYTPYLHHNADRHVTPSKYGNIREGKRSCIVGSSIARAGPCACWPSACREVRPQSSCYYHRTGWSQCQCPALGHIS